MSEHTPGPWLFDGVCQIVEAARPHMRVCFLPSDHHEYASSKPNGRLIAAAPDMLAALKLAADSIKELDGGDQRSETGWKADEHLDTWLEIRAAIAKAEGQSVSHTSPKSP